MGLGSLGCYVWWFTLGALASWLLWWLIERLFLRDTETPRLLSEAQTEIEALKSADGLRLAEIEELQAQTQQQAADIARLREELQRYNGIEQAYEAEYNKVLADHNRLSQELAKNVTEAGALKASLESSAAKIAGLAALETELEQIRAREAGLKTEFADISQQLAATRSETDTLRRKLNEQTGSSGDTTKLTAALDAARSEIETKTSEIARLKREWTIASEHSAKTARLQLELEQRDGRLKGLEAESDTLKSILIESKSALERQRDDIARLKDELARSSHSGADMKSLSSEIERLKASEANLRAEVNAVRSSEKHVTDQLATASQRIAALEKLRSKFEAAREAAAGYASEVARLNEEFDASLKSDPGPDGKKS